MGSKTSKPHSSSTPLLDEHKKQPADDHVPMNYDTIATPAVAGAEQDSEPSQEHFKKSDRVTIREGEYIGKEGVIRGQICEGIFSVELDREKKNDRRIREKFNVTELKKCAINVGTDVKVCEGRFKNLKAIVGCYMPLPMSWNLNLPKGKAVCYKCQTVNEYDEVNPVKCIECGGDNHTVVIALKGNIRVRSEDDSSWSRRLATSTLPIESSNGQNFALGLTAMAGVAFAALLGKVFCARFLRKRREPESPHDVEYKYLARMV